MTASPAQTPGRDVPPPRVTRCPRSAQEGTSRRTESGESLSANKAAASSTGGKDASLDRLSKAPCCSLVPGRCPSPGGAQAGAGWVAQPAPGRAEDGEMMLFAVTCRRELASFKGKKNMSFPLN